VKKVISYNTEAKNQIIPITEDIAGVAKESGIKNGTLFAYTLHTTLGLIMQESCEPFLCQDIIDQLTKIVDDNGAKYKHRCSANPKKLCKTDDINGPSHVRQALTNQSIVIDIENGKLNLGTYQDIGLVEFDGPRKDRKVLVKIIKD